MDRQNTDKNMRLDDFDAGEEQLDDSEGDNNGAVLDATTTSKQVQQKRKKLGNKLSDYMGSVPFFTLFIRWFGFSFFIPFSKIFIHSVFVFIVIF